MQKNYELFYIVHPDLEGSIDKITEKVAGFITKASGKITSQEDWGKRKLAYKIAKNDFGIYSLVYFDIESTKLSEVERDLRLAEEIMRSMIVAIPVISPVTAAKKKPRIKKDEVSSTKEEPASIIVAEEKPAKANKAVKSTKKTEETVEETKQKAEKKTVVKKTTTAKKTTVVSKAKVDSEAVKKTAKTVEKEEKERLKKLDEKLDELLK